MSHGHEEPVEDSFWQELDELPEPEPADWGGDELEQAYLRAMEVLEASDANLPLPATLDPSNDSAAVNVESSSALIAATDPEHRIDSAQFDAELSTLAAKSIEQASSAPPVTDSITPRQILEALVFVGGEPLTTRKLSNVLRGEFSTEFIESQLDELNSLYAREGRPYEIRLGDGGYRMCLRDDFERIRRKVFGLGPREVKLTQEAIEVLAVVAYHQPVTMPALEELGKPNCGAILRQLLRRELISVVRKPEVTYQTTARFLSLFGIRSLHELPRLEQVTYK